MNPFAKGKNRDHAAHDAKIARRSYANIEVKPTCDDDPTEAYADEVSRPLLEKIGELEEDNERLRGIIRQLREPMKKKALGEHFQDAVDAG